MPYKDKQKHYECVKRAKAKKPEYYKTMAKRNKQAASRRGYHMNYKYGISLDTANSLLESQGGCCAICGKTPPPTKTGRSGLHIDHCHISQKVRGMLCARCNTFVGYADKTGFDEMLLKTKEYLIDKGQWVGSCKDRNWRQWRNVYRQRRTNQDDIRSQSIQFKTL